MKMPDEIKLKPCPFCGGVATTISDGVLSEDSLFWVRCCGCGAETSIFDSEKEAKEAWNRRAEHE